jgi:Domain of unknown function (DUF3524)
MSTQLDILALEPFYGGARRAMLETLVRHSRHRWTVLKLPPRRIERRLEVAANWFSEQLKAHWVGRVDLLFTSEAMNLASLLRLTPALVGHPSVVYFHDNQLPDLSVREEQPLDLVNLSTATAATEIWFNSAYHQQTFMIRASALVDRHPELSNRNPMAQLTGKARLMLPPVSWRSIDELRSSNTIQRSPRTIFFDTRDANMDILNEGLGLLRRKGVTFNAVTVGPVDSLDPEVPRYTAPERDEASQARGMLESSIVVSAKPEAASDYLAIRALIAGCRPVLPDGGVYPELLPRPLHASCLYYVDGEGLAESLESALDPSRPEWHGDGFRKVFQPYDAIPACRAFDDRLEQLVASHPAPRQRSA